MTINKNIIKCSETQIINKENNNKNKKTIFDDSNNLYNINNTKNEEKNKNNNLNENYDNKKDSNGIPSEEIITNKSYHECDNNIIRKQNNIIIKEKEVKKKIIDLSIGHNQHFFLSNYKTDEKTNNRTDKYNNNINNKMNIKENIDNINIYPTEQKINNSISNKNIQININKNIEYKIENKAFSIQSKIRKHNTNLSVNKLEIELINNDNNNKNKNFNIADGDSEIYPIVQDKALTLTSCKNKQTISNQSNNIINNSINNENNDIDEKEKNKYTDEANVSEQHEVDNNEEDIKTTLIKKTINIYDIDNYNNDNMEEKDKINEKDFNISSDRSTCNQPKNMKTILSEKIKEIFSHNNTNNNTTHIIYNLDKKPGMKKELIYSSNFKKITVPKTDSENKVDLKNNEDLKDLANKTIDDNENEKVGHILQFNTIRTKSTNQYLPISSNRDTNNNKLNNQKKMRNKKKVNFNMKVEEEIIYQSKSITVKKNNNFKSKFKTENQVDTHYLLYSGVPLGVPQFIKDNYKLFRKKTPENKKIEYLRTYYDQ